MSSSQPRKKRKQGRPDSADNAVGREGVLAAATKLLKELPPARVTITAVAREAGIDPALVRYYFGGREALLLAAVQRIADGGDPLPDASRPVEALEHYVHRVFRFTRSARYMQRLMIEELDSAQSPEVRERAREWNKGPVDFYQEILRQDAGRELEPFDALFLHLAIIGISDFFVSGAPLIEMLVPPGTDMAELDKRYEAFVTRLLLDGLRKR